MAHARHLILISIDDFRFDALSCEKDRTYLRRMSLDHLPHTPNLDRIAQEGFRFTQFRATAPSTTPSHASMFTGLYPPNNGVRIFVGQRLSKSKKSLFHRLNAAGFSSLASISSPALFRVANLADGARNLNPWEDRFILDEMEGLRGRNQRTFSFLHMGDCHVPYGFTYCDDLMSVNEEVMDWYYELAKRCGAELPKRPRLDGKKQHLSPFFPVSEALESWARNHQKLPAMLFPLYLLGTNRFDAIRFKRFISALESRKLLDDTLLVVTSDHGEAIIPRDGQAGFGHGESCREELLRIPLIFWSKAQGFNRGTSDMPVSMVDLAPTVLDALGVDYRADEFDGTSRAPLLSDSWKKSEAQLIRAKVPSLCYAESWFQDPNTFLKAQRILDFLAADPTAEVTGEMKLLLKTTGARLAEQTVRSGSLKQIWKPDQRRFLFEVDRDPFERVDLSGLGFHPPALERKLQTELERIAGKKSLFRKEARSSSKSLKSKELSSLKRDLKKLGYI